MYLPSNPSIAPRPGIIPQPIFQSVLWLAFSCVWASAAEVRVASPDGRLAIVLSDQDGIQYRVEMDQKSILANSKLGLRFEGGVVLGPTAKILNSDTRENRGEWANRFGKRSKVRDDYNEIRVDLGEKKPADRAFGLVARAYNDGVAFRYAITEDTGLGEFTLVEELTGFNFTTDHPCWAGDSNSCAECQYPETRLSAIPSTAKDGKPHLSTLPLVVRTPQAFVAIAESDLRDWAGMFLSGTGGPAVKASLAERGDGRGCVVSQNPRNSPWRVIMVGRSENDLVLSDLIANLATPSQIADTTWIKPGISSWDSWWTGINPNHPEKTGLDAFGDNDTHKDFIDLSAEMGWPYKMVDWFWYENMTSYDVILNLNRTNPPRPPVDLEHSVPHVDLPGLVNYAESKNVKLFVWLHSYDLHRYGIEKACALFSRMGVVGLKIDFMNSDSQETVNWYEEVLAAAARHRIMIDFHGAYKPTGLARTWPNYITQEGVLGNEYNKIPGARCTAKHHVTLPFTRGLLGPMDFTPGGFINKTAADFKITHPAEVVGTRARQLAMTVAYESPLLVLCDSPANYRNAPGIEFFRNLPTVWDETAVPSAAMARHLVIARRSGDRWWLAAMNADEPLTLKIPLAFLGGRSWTMRSFADAPDSAAKPQSITESSRVVQSGDHLELRLAPAGGFAATLSPLK